jgi:hypothetical protein
LFGDDVSSVGGDDIFEPAFDVFLVLSTLSSNNSVDEHFGVDDADCELTEGANTNKAKVGIPEHDRLFGTELHIAVWFEADEINRCLERVIGVSEVKELRDNWDVFRGQGVITRP